MNLHVISSAERALSIYRFWQSAKGFWQGSYQVWALVGLTVATVLLELLVQYRLNIWNRDFFNALERKDGTELWHQVGLFAPLVAASTMLAIVGVWGRMTVQRKWRHWLSKQLISLWLTRRRYCRLHLVPGDHDNPEYRIAEDARVATDAPIDLAFGLLQAVLTAITFINVLWAVGGYLTLEGLGLTLVVPGYLVVAAILYATLITSSMLVIGRRLVPVVEGKNDAEAQLRQAAARLHHEALLGGRYPENGNLVSALESALEQVIERWRYLCGQLMRTTLISHGNFLLSPLVGLILCAPKYLSDAMTLGEVAQAAAAFVTVQASFNWLVENYPRLADWRSSAHRVGTLLVALDAVDGLETPAGNSQAEGI